MQFNILNFDKMLKFRTSKMIYIIIIGINLIYTINNHDYKILISKITKI